MEKLIFGIVAISSAALIIWFLHKALTHQQSIRTMLMDGLWVIWFEYGWTGASPHVHEWVKGRWRFVGRAKSVAAEDIRLGTKEKVRELTRKAIEEVEQRVFSWEQRELNRQTRNNT